MDRQNVEQPMVIQVHDMAIREAEELGVQISLAMPEEEVDLETGSHDRSCHRAGRRCDRDFCG